MTETTWNQIEDIARIIDDSGLKQSIVIQSFDESSWMYENNLIVNSTINLYTLPISGRYFQQDKTSVFMQI